jgi:hypothetical protein
MVKLTKRTNGRTLGGGVRMSPFCKALNGYAYKWRRTSSNGVQVTFKPKQAHSIEWSRLLRFADLFKMEKVAELHDAKTGVVVLLFSTKEKV